MIVAKVIDPNEKSTHATFLKVRQNLYRNESSETYYGLTKRGGKQFRSALRSDDGTPIKDRSLAERALRKWLDELEHIRPEAIERDENFAIVEKRGSMTILVGGLAKRKTWRQRGRTWSAPLVNVGNDKRMNTFRWLARTGHRLDLASNAAKNFQPQMGFPSPSIKTVHSEF